MGDDLEFTEADMFGELERPSDENQLGASNSAKLTQEPGTSSESKAEKLKRQRSTAQDTSNSLTPSPDTKTLSKQPSDSLNPVTDHFNQQGQSEAVGQSMAIRKGRDSAGERHSTERDEEDRQLKRLGTSVPITIPGREKAMTSKHKDSTGDLAKPSTFVPPHMLSQSINDSRPQSLNSGSMAKRDQLLQRNKILRRTGFLEGGGLEVGSKSGGLSELMDPLNRRLLPIKESYLEPSALSAALGTPRKE